MKLTKKEAARLHWELWDWLSRNPKKKKTEWPDWAIYGDITSYCFACEYDGQHNAEEDCSKCLLQFIPNDKDVGTYPYCLGGLYQKWIDTEEDSVEHSRLAAQIRDLPIRKFTRKGVIR